MGLADKLRKRARHLLANKKKSEELLPMPVHQMDGVERKAKRAAKTVARGESFVVKFGRFEESTARTAFVIIPGEVVDGGHEITRLTESLGLHIVGTKHLKPGRRIAGATFIGEGTIEQVDREMHSQSKDDDDGQRPLVIIDAQLSPGQIRNLENALECPVLDRRVLILAIFKRNARSAVAKLQVELAELQILKSRLAGVWEGLSRQRGAAGGKGARGLGETRLELDRRALKRRVEMIREKLTSAERVFYTQSKARSQFPRVALVGYTNAGKSSLMQKLTQSAVVVEDRLFATLDTTVRTLQPLTKPKVIVSDTVGFVRDLPTELVASFKSTLLEAVSSKLLLNVVDISDPAWQEHLTVTESTLADIGAGEIPKIYVLNKVDVLESFPKIRAAEARRFLEREFGVKSKFVLTSALNDEGLGRLRELLLEELGIAPLSI